MYAGFLQVSMRRYAYDLISAFSIIDLTSSIGCTCVIQCRFVSTDRKNGRFLLIMSSLTE